MKKIILVIMLCAFGLGFGQDELKNKLWFCEIMIDIAETTYDMKAGFECKYTVLDNRLNENYQRILKSSTPEFIELLRTDQRAWLKTRTNFFDNWKGEGSIAPILKLQDRIELLENRIEYLKLISATGFRSVSEGSAKQSGIEEQGLMEFKKENGDMVYWNVYCESGSECTTVIKMNGEYYLLHPKAIDPEATHLTNPQRTMERIKFVGYGRAYR